MVSYKVQQFAHLASGLVTHQRILLIGVNKVCVTPIERSVSRSAILLLSANTVL